ncbi:flagellar motor switch phosphatase FliY [Heliorestis acidaminivorans]|uniref:Flagellar motor switch phosphatase FliY n=2 Tax=Heliorestis acidaminivorans TaxID=553427 RepID=A0A6I0F6T2_9FIRM|nr:flagellar motor switch phosphatase FliY [Heliorestis acidaminivorans]KAB2954682.1 flagellar motor switch phosphatase FliY [Heliorestis acidaminivorans]
MSSGVLSQEEIDALLKGSDADTSPAEDNLTAPVDPNNSISDMEKDVIGEIANISMGTAATTLSTLLGKKVDITTPRVSLTSKTEIQRDYPSPFVVVDVHYTAGLEGNNVLVIKESDVAIIVDLMMGGDGSAPPIELSELHFSAISEAMNQMMGSASTSMATMLNKKIDISPPELNKVDFASEELQHPESDPVVKVAFRMVIEGLIDSELMQIFPIPFSKALTRGLMGDSSESAATNTAEVAASVPPSTAPFPDLPGAATASPMAAGPSAVTAPQQPMPQHQPPQVPPMGSGSEPYGAPPPQHYYGPPPGYGNYYHHPQQGMMYPPPQPPTPSSIPVQPVQFSPLQGQTSSKEVGNLNLIMDVPLQVTVELGKTKKTIRDILELGSGSVIELDKLAGEPVDILVNGKLVAKGEVVVIDENFGVRITDIVNPIERIGNLQ